jgi:predicted metal-dependent HD superfamily phosphohydrolase
MVQMDLDSIAHRWSPLLDGGLLASAPELLPELARRYAEPHRGYHGIDHITALAQLFVDVASGPGWRSPIEVALAILFHDAIYEPGRSDNEDRSADLAIEILRNTPISKAVDLDRVAAMIRATKSHDQHTHADDHDLAHFIDADMAIIGTSPNAYDAYAKAVRREFASIPIALFDRGREAFLTKQLARPTLFHTPWFRARYEAPARANLARELATLRGNDR